MAVLALLEEPGAVGKMRGNAEKGTMMINKFQIWIDTREKYHLSHAQIQMARELGVNPRGFGKIANHRKEHWKLPLDQFIEGLYFKHFGRASPEHVTSIESKAKKFRRQKEERKRRRRANRESGIHPIRPDL